MPASWEAQKDCEDLNKYNNKNKKEDDKNENKKAGKD